MIKDNTGEPLYHMESAGGKLANGAKTTKSKCLH